MSNKSIDEFMSWLDYMIEEYTMDDGYEMNIMEVPTHQRHEREGMVKMLKIVENKTKEVGFITPKIRGEGLEVGE